MKILLLLALYSPYLLLASNLAQHLEQLDFYYEAHKPHHFSTAPWGKLTNKNQPTRHPWPFTLKSIGHIPSSYQNYGWGSEAYFHHGIDIIGEAGQSVKAAASGKVVNIENYATSDLYWEIAILDHEGFLWQYHHIDHNTITEQVRKAYQTGEEIPAGTKIGDIVYWPVVTFGERFNHVHLNVLDGQLNYINPFRLLTRLDDRTAPKIVNMGLIKSNGRITKKHTIAPGNYSLFVHVEDYIKHTKFKLPPYKISFQMDSNNQELVWEFQNLPGGTSNEHYVHDFFQKKSCGDYDCRDFYINLNFNKDHPRQFSQIKGKHTITVFVEDYAGNKDQASFTWSVR